MFITKIDFIETYKNKFPHFDFIKIPDLITNGKTSVKMSCGIHGEFDTKVNSLRLSKFGGCKACFSENRSDLNLKSFSVEKFKKKARLIHGRKFDYSKVHDENYSAYLKIEIGCPAHGFFIQEAGYHLLKGHGCPKCGQKSTNQKLKKKLNIKEFIQQSKELFGKNTFDYSLVKEDCYTGGRPMVTLICREHGHFTVNAKDHLGNYGARCKRCTRKESYGEFLIRRILERLNICFNQQKTFEDFRNPKTGRKLYFDFYLPQHNTLIEFDGEYHFIPPNFIKLSELQLTVVMDKIKKRDQMKTDYANKSGFRLLRIHYSNRNPKDIRTIIENEIIKDTFIEKSVPQMGLTVFNLKGYQND